MDGPVTPLFYRQLDPLPYYSQGVLMVQAKLLAYYLKGVLVDSELEGTLAVRSKLGCSHAGWPLLFYGIVPGPYYPFVLHIESRS